LRGASLVSCLRAPSQHVTARAELAADSRREALPRGDEPTGVAHPTHIFKARAPAAHEYPAHDKNAWTQTKYTVGLSQSLLNTGPPEHT